jgi:hypothetical protein
LKLITPVPPFDNFEILLGVSVPLQAFRKDCVLGRKGSLVSRTVVLRSSAPPRVLTPDALAELVRDTLANIIDPAG